jgi:hypothetical protein
MDRKRHKNGGVAYVKPPQTLPIFSTLHPSSHTETHLVSVQYQLVLVGTRRKAITLPVGSHKRARSGTVSSAVSGPGRTELTETPVIGSHIPIEKD